MGEVWGGGDEGLSGSATRPLEDLAVVAGGTPATRTGSVPVFAAPGYTPVVLALIAAAGQSSRMGSPKALLDFGGRPLITEHCLRYLAAGLDVRVVLGAHANRIAPVLPSAVLVVHNPVWAQSHYGDSVALGLSLPSPAPAAIIQPVDVPPVAPQTLQLLLARTGDAVPSYHGQDGHPIRLEGALVGRLDVRLRDAPRIVIADADAILNLNTPEQWRAWRSGTAPLA